MTTAVAELDAPEVAQEMAFEGQGQPVLVTTKHRGVFFGYLDSPAREESLKLKAARNCIYWSADVKGFLGLCSFGPNANCRIGPAADIELFGITCVAKVSARAAEAWEKAPWSSN